VLTLRSNLCLDNGTGIPQGSVLMLLVLLLLMLLLLLLLPGVAV
jgi:hypothetical protein